MRSLFRFQLALNCALIESNHHHHHHYCGVCLRIPLSLTWAGKTISLEVYWFQYESDPALNSNVYAVANKAVSDHFPGEFGSERLVQQAVDHILKVTENEEGMEQVSGHHPSQEAGHASAAAQSPPNNAAASGVYVCVCVQWPGGEVGTQTIA